MTVALYTAAQVRALEAALQAQAGLDAATLMARAGAAVARHLRATWPQARRVLVVAGTGNNGGDGYELALRLVQAGIAVQVVALAASRSPVAQAAAARWQSAGGSVRDWLPGSPLPAADLVADAVFGIGLVRAPDPAAAALIEAINEHPAPVLAIDVASGLDADRGSAPGACVRARRTVVLLARKRGLQTGAAVELCGRLAFDDLACAALLPSMPDTGCTLLAASDVQAVLAPRPRGAHKGDHGFALLVGGDEGMSGALRLAGHAALRTGAGWVALATRARHAAAVAQERAELMVHGIEDGPALAPMLARATAVAIGPGLGQGRWAQALLAAALDVPAPLVLDADALNLLARAPAPLAADRILTPHPGEAARLLGLADAGAVEVDRFAAARALAQRFAAVVVLKGAGTVVDDGERTWVCPFGNPGMASAGMGDALTGVIVALLAQGLSVGVAARTGVLIHALAGDAAARGGERGLLAGDLIARLRGVLAP
jgi:NAD(P)H-hydrate epimerase